jgi:ABC-type polysaccharide/polyol phosphate transport system ATPase subunit
VGDAAFQAKCEERMESFKTKGVTIVLVSHDLSLIQGACQTAIWIHHGQVVATGSADKVVAEYQKFSASSSV